MAIDHTYLLTAELEQLDNHQLVEFMTIINERICGIIQSRCIEEGADVDAFFLTLQPDSNLH